jgi:hypothetical protein
MNAAQNSETPHERRVTWSLMAAVVAFVLLMTCLVLWITTSLIRNELGGSRQSGPTNTVNSNTANPTSTITQAVSETPIPPTPTQAAAQDAPILVDATWTPVPGLRSRVRFLYWYVKPNKIRVGECLQLTWETENAASLQLYRNDELILADAPASKTLQDCPKQPGYAVYRMVAKNRAGESNWIQLQVKVEEAP